MDCCFAPSPSGSVDSGLGLSPRSTNSSQESPNYVIGNVTGFHKKEELLFGCWNSDINNQLGNFSVCNVGQQSILAQNISTSTGLSRDQDRKTSKGHKRRNTASEHSEKLKKCLEPKTGNKKPRQTSSKRKNKMEGRKTYEERGRVYPGVRPKTVREKLNAIREKKNAASVSTATPQQSQHSNIIPLYQFQPSCASNSMAFHSQNLTPEVSSDMLSSFGDDMPQIPPVLVNSILNDSEPQIDQNFSPQSTCYSPFTPDYQSSVLTSFSPINSPAPSFSPAMSDFTTSESFNVFSPEGTDVYSNISMPIDTLYPSFQPAQPNCLVIENIFDCVRKGDNIQLENLLASQFDLNQIDNRNEFGMTPLLCAVKSGNLIAINLLLNFGANPMVTSQPEVKNIFHFAADNANAVQFLCGKIPIECGNKLINDGKLGGQTPLYVAAEIGNPDTVTSFLSRGAQLNVQEHQNGWTPLHIAVKKGDIAVLQRILRHIANFRGTKFHGEIINQTTCSENTALHFAAELPSIEENSKSVKENIIKALIENGADVCKKNNENRSPFNLLPSGQSQLHAILRPNRRRVSSVSSGLFPAHLESFSTQIFSE